MSTDTYIEEMRDLHEQYRQKRAEGQPVDARAFHDQIEALVIIIKAVIYSMLI